MHIRSVFTVASVAMAFALARPAGAGMISSFESDTGGWKAADSKATISQDSTGATDGAYSLKVVNSASGWDNTMSLDPADFAQFQAPNGLLQFDVTAFPADVPAGWLNVTPVLNSQAQNWQQLADQHIVLDGTPHTYTVDFSTITTPAPGSGWFQLYMPSNSGQPATFYIDNIRTAPVPEPAALGLALAGGLLLSIRRRRR